MRYWLLLQTGGEFEPNEEVDEIRWLQPEAAVALLSYEHDQELVRELGSPIGWQLNWLASEDGRRREPQTWSRR